MEKCKSCKAEIEWGVTEAGKRVPLDPPQKRYVSVQHNPTHLHRGDGQFHVAIQDTWLSHFATCPQADEHRKN